jgi:hypothetical protein
MIFLAGRSYPMEGTAVVLPQYAPFTDPLEVLVCGGSTPVEGTGLDSCISIAPEVPNSTWVYERMVSGFIHSNASIADILPLAFEACHALHCRAS